MVVAKEQKERADLGREEWLRLRMREEEAGKDRRSPG